MCHHAQCCNLIGGLSRREFLVATAGTALTGDYVLRRATAAEADRRRQPETAGARPLVRVAYLRPKEKYWLGWPGTAWEATAHDGFMATSHRRLEQWCAELKLGLSFESEPIYDEAATDAFISRVQAEKPAALVIFPLHMMQWKNAKKIAEAGMPTIIFAGLGMCFTPHLAKLARQPGVHVISTTDWELNPLRFGLKMVRANHDLRRTRIAVLAGNETKDEVLEPLGLQLRRLPRQRFADVLREIGETSDVLALADEYQRAAEKVVEPSRADVVNAARNYFAARRIIEEEQCDGITMDCLGAVFDRQIPCPPCLAWSRFLDAGVPAICEADVNAVMSLTLCCTLLDQPGFMQDPVPETVRNTFIGAHCVCPTRLDGFDRPRAKFRLRSHSESNIGVSLQVLWPVNQTLTVMQFTAPDKMILGRGRVLDNLETPPNGGCRTSVEVALEGPPDVRDVKGFHQLFIAGDHVREFQAYGQMFGIATESI